ncbi:MAG: hypothetical protein JWQ09_3131 [Segetibacter sp.]|nr:hypothetical protein [Segetibacter sp.]
MKAPTWLSHKPIVEVSNYSAIDGKYVANTDVVALSIGTAQWDEDDMSAKVWRYKKDSDRWSRQSEELPLHRVLDLSILLLASFIKDRDSDFPLTNLGETITDKSKLNLIDEYYRENKGKINPRIEELERIIKEFKKKKR